MAHGVIPRKEMTRYERISILMAFLVFLGSILPWYVLIIERTSYFLGIMTTVGTFVMVLGFEMIFLMWLRRPVIEGIDNSTVTMFMSLLVMCISIYVLRYAFFSEFILGQLVEGFAGTGLYLDIVASFLLLLFAYKVRSDRRTAGQGAFATGTATEATPVPAQGELTAKEKGTGLSLGSIFVSRPKADTSEKPEKAVPTEGSGTGKSDDKPTGMRSVRPASQSTGTSSQVGGSSEPDRETLLRWLNHVTRDKQVYERCPGCGSYAFMDVRKKGEAVRFSCRNCASEYNLVL